MKRSLQASRAYAKALLKAGLIELNECNDIVRGLGMIDDEWINGTFTVQPTDEDIHTANERRLKVCKL